MPRVLLAKRWLPVTAVIFAGAALCVRLGLWQLDRLAQRRESNARIAFVTALPAALLPSGEDLQ